MDMQMVMIAGAFAAGTGAGLLLAKLVGGKNSGAAQPGGDRVFEAAGSTCPKCRRPLLPGVKGCPFCDPVIPQESPLGATVVADHRPLEELIPMPGLATAAKQMREAGARGYLHIFTGANKGQSVLLGATPVTVGRAPENTLILKDEGVSQRHAEIRAKGDQYYTRDVGSKNGTFVNDQRVGDERRLVSGDVLAVGETKMLFQVG
jgi:hypothetical protein